MSNLTVKGIRARLVNIRNRFGADYVPENPESDNTCTYAVVVDGVLTPVCLIGQMFADMGLLGLLVRDLTDAQDTGHISQEGACDTGGAVWQALAKVGIETDPEAQKYARSAQYGQDNGLTWGQSIAYADGVYLARQRREAASLAGIETWSDDWLDPSVSDFRS